MAKVKVLFGEMTFFDEQIDGKHETIVHTVQKIEMVEEEKLDNHCEEMLDNFTSYLIPEQYNGKIVYELNCMNSLGR
jgi:hypothetical protein